MVSKLITALIALILISCENSSDKPEKSLVNSKVKDLVVTTEKSKADSIINLAINAHGGELYKATVYSFTLRGKNYKVHNLEDNFKYSVTSIDTIGNMITDELKNDSFSRKLNGKIVQLTNEEKSKYSKALNSVIYFAQLPYKLNDASVSHKYIEKITIKGKKYHAIAVSFTADGGGEDHEDEYLYWISTENNKIDYFAYNYRVNGGGARFRAAYNRQVVNGITFQDYINWESEFETPLKEIPILYEGGLLYEVSRIELENTIVS